MLADEANLARIGRAIKGLRGEVIAVPPFAPEYLLRGHAGGDPSRARVRFWLMEARTPELLVELAGHFPEERAALESARSLLAEPLEVSRLIDLLAQQERAERAADREYWLPLKRELEAMRRGA